MERWRQDALKSEPHFDGNNMGPSKGVSFGEHSGGELWLADDANPCCAIPETAHTAARAGRCDALDT